jgi:hypothetical protein
LESSVKITVFSRKAPKIDEKQKQYSWPELSDVGNDAFTTGIIFCIFLNMPFVINIVK